MDQSVRIGRPDGSLAASVLGVAVIVGLGFAAVSLGRDRAAHRHRRLDRRERLVTYLREHLAGSDAAIQVVERLRLTHAGTQEGRLFASLFDEFREERDIVRGLLDQLGASTLSTKRVAGQAGGRVLMFAADGERGDLSLFRTLEGLALGVQGKRSMWRALHALLGEGPIPSARSLGGLEAMAARQWDAIEERRLALVSATFPAVQLPPADVPVD